MSNKTLPQEMQIKYRQLAIELIKRGARVPVVKSLLPIEESLILKIYKDVTGTTSPTGPLPSDPAWYTKTQVPMVVIDSSLFMSIYNTMSELAPEAHETEIIVEAYDSYLSHCQRQEREPRLNLVRCWALIRFYKIHELEFVKCTACQSNIIQLPLSIYKNGNKFICCLCNRPTSLRKANYVNPNAKSSSDKADNSAL